MLPFEALNNGVIRNAYGQEATCYDFVSLMRFSYGRSGAPAATVRYRIARLANKNTIEQLLRERQHAITLYIFLLGILY